ncbi:hypothetical protein QVD17_11385 [Tagetes erecta]|uniref:DUF7054 domain-containing protein n=1 Tax=Tagetes erecta TaxID=13708 RepID=A0AAD8P238_TARER|nr:hypothetical protein QVD17_11385 [Tagetes erecta]
MSTKKNSPKLQAKNKKGKLPEKSMSFHGRVSDDIVAKLTRPRTLPELFSGKSVVTMGTVMTVPKLTKLLVNVTVERSLGPVHVLMSPEASVGELIVAVLRQYLKEGRRPVFSSLDGSQFHLHYSQFSLESLSPDAKLIELGSRNFFLCPKQQLTVDGSGGGSGDEGGIGYSGVTGSSSRCSKEATKRGTVWLKFMEFML